MITIISGTNRQDNKTVAFARHVYNLMQTESNTEVKFLDLAAMPTDWFHALMYQEDGQTASLRKIQDDCILPAKKFIFVIPEYNGSMPGTVKLFIDACSIRNYADNFKGKKAALIGCSSGRAGNLRGMEHLTGVLNYLGCTVMPNRLPISQISGLMNAKNEITDEKTLEILEKFAKEFTAF